MNELGYAWLNDKEHSEEDRSRAIALAKKWSSLRCEIEQEGFLRQADYEDGRGEEEPDSCEVCGGDAKLGIDGPRNRWGTLKNWPDWAVGIACPNVDCEDGYDLKYVRLAREARKEKEAERQVEIDIVEEMLARLGARIMRPYEHWGEEESRIQYAEDARYDG